MRSNYLVSYILVENPSPQCQKKLRRNCVSERELVLRNCFAQLLLATLLTFFSFKSELSYRTPLQGACTWLLPCKANITTSACCFLPIHNDSVITCSCSYAVFIIHEKSLVSRIDDGIYQIFSDSCVRLNNSGLNNCCVLWRSRRGYTTSLMHQFSKANVAFLDPKATLTSWILVNVLDLFWFILQKDTKPPEWTLPEALICWEICARTCDGIQLTHKPWTLHRGHKCKHRGEARCNLTAFTCSWAPATWIYTCCKQVILKENLVSLRLFFPHAYSLQSLHKNSCFFFLPVNLQESISLLHQCS